MTSPITIPPRTDNSTHTRRNDPYKLPVIPPAEYDAVNFIPPAEYGAVNFIAQMRELRKSIFTNPVNYSHESRVQWLQSIRHSFYQVIPLLSHRNDLKLSLHAEYARILSILIPVLNHKEILEVYEEASKLALATNQPVPNSLLISVIHTIRNTPAHQETIESCYLECLKNAHENGWQVDQKQVEQCIYEARKHRFQATANAIDGLYRELFPTVPTSS